MLDMGFLPDVRYIISKLPERRQTLLFSATIPETIERFAATILHDPVRLRIAPVRETTELIEHSVFFVPQKQKDATIGQFAEEPGQSPGRWFLPAPSTEPTA